MSQSSFLEWYPSDPTRSCIRTNALGHEYEEISCLYPIMQSTYQRIEYDEKLQASIFYNVIEPMYAHPWVPVVACVLYGVGIVAGKSYFKTRKPWNCRTALALWNLSLSVFSLVGFTRTLPSLLHNMWHYSLTENLCFEAEQHYGSGSTGFWVLLFVLSKFPELVDTFFIVVHKKPLILLHWYHHISVLLFCWQSYAAHSPTGIYFCVMNYAVHAIMYFYYFLMAVRAKPKWFNAVWITVAQITQMVCGVTVTAVGWYLLTVVKPDKCSLSRTNNLAALVMYGSYLFLFLQFFFQRYFSTSTSKSSAGFELFLPSKKAKAPTGGHVISGNGVTICTKVEDKGFHINGKRAVDSIEEEKKQSDDDCYDVSHLEHRRKKD